MREINRTIVGALIVDTEGRVLLGQKDPGKGGVYKECWHAPGGGVEEGESQTQALARELQEEVGLDLSLTTYSLLDDTGTGSSEKKLPSGETVLVHMRFYMYEVVIPRNLKESVSPVEEFVRLNWFEKPQLTELNLTPPGRALFKKLGWI